MHGKYRSQYAVELRLAEHIANVRFKQLESSRPAGYDFRRLRYSGEIRSVSPYRHGGDVGYKSGLASAQALCEINHASRVSCLQASPPIEWPFSAWDWNLE